MLRYTIGLEVHIKLSTEHKMFCRCLNSQDFDTIKPNSHICPICTAQPWALPIINPEAITTAIRLWTIFWSTLHKDFSWDRKSYFYPDSPVWFQITQYHQPIIQWGHVQFFTDHFQTPHDIHIHEAHLENDTAKTITINDTTFIDFNRSWGPLIEIVTKPEFHSDEQVIEFLKELQRIIKLNHIWYADLEKGQMRVDVNISVANEWSSHLGTRVEIKNLNSFASIRKAIAYEYERHTQCITNNQPLDQETRRRDDQTGTTITMRSKEQAMDYRYVPEHDLPMIDPNTISWKPSEHIITWYDKIQQLKAYWFHKEYIYWLLNSDLLFEWFQEWIDHGLDPKLIAKWLMGPVTTFINVYWESAIKLDSKWFITFLDKLNTYGTPEAIAKPLFETLIHGNTTIDKSIDQFTIHQERSINVADVITTVLENNPWVVSEYLGGKTTTIGFLLGQVMKATWWALNPQELKTTIEQMITQMK